VVFFSLHLREKKKKQKTGEKEVDSTGKIDLTLLCQCTLIPWRGRLGFFQWCAFAVGLMFCSHDVVLTLVIIKLELTYCSMEPHS
jgi:hypothetical protein